ncbi:hypothetical protein LCGC14_2860630 [marine sediment metagenome]|uniref:Uncharacterized protein n=1 Tax=marine sediment metagenome TaxID=412755 RepID=A0A0F8Y600_9ZZZZ
MNHRELIKELAKALVQLCTAILREVNADPNLFLGKEMDEALRQVQVALEKTKLIEDCIPIEDAYEVVLDEGH